MITLQEANRRLIALGVAPLKVPAASGQPATSRNADSRTDRKVQERIDQLERQHAEKIAKLRAEADKKIADRKQESAGNSVVRRRHRELLREEMMERRRQADRVELDYRRDWREQLQEMGGPLSAYYLQQIQDEDTEANANPNEPAVVTMRGWLERVWTEHQIDVRVCVEPLLLNGAAQRDSRYIEIAPIRSPRTALIAAHEVGHLLHPLIPNERKVKGEYGRSVSPQSELASWYWVLAHTPVWTQADHDFMTRCVTSYRSYMNETEQEDLERLCSAAMFKLVKLRILQGATWPDGRPPYVIPVSQTSVEPPPTAA